MELHFTTTIEHPYPSVAAVLSEGPLAWLPDVELAQEAYVTQLAIGEEDHRVSRRVIVSTGAMRPLGYGVAMPVEWQAAEHPERYPTLSGSLRLEPAGPAGTRLRLDAHYRPPGGKLGAAADRALLHRVAEASVRDFVERVAERLRRSVRFSGRWEPE